MNERLEAKALTETVRHSAMTAPGLPASEQLLWLSSDERHARVVDAIRDDVAALMMVADPRTIEVECPLHRYGFDGLGSQMLAECIEALLDVELSRELELHQVSIQVIASWALTRWFDARARHRAPGVSVH